MPAISTNRKNFETAKEQGNLVPIEKSVVVNPTPPIPVYLGTLNANLRTPLPAAHVQQPDMQRQWQTGATPQQRIPPTSLTGNPIVGAQTITNIVAASVAASSAAVPVTDIESISINKQTVTAYNVQLSDLDSLITLNNNSGGTVTLPGPGGTFSFVQKAHTDVGSDIGTVAITNGRGNLVFLEVWSGRVFANTTFTVTDTLGNTWTQLYIATDAGGNAVSAWYAQGVAPGANTITVTAVHGAGGSANIVISVAEYSGIRSSGSLDAFSNAANTSVTITTATANDLVIFSAASTGGGAHASIAPWISRYDIAFAFGRQIIQDQIVPLSGTVV